MFLPLLPHATCHIKHLQYPLKKNDPAVSTGSFFLLSLFTLNPSCTASVDPLGRPITPFILHPSPLTPPLGESEGVILFFRLGFMGNQPRWTRRCCWCSSSMLQKQEKATTPRMMLAYSFGTKSEATRATMPATRNRGQHCLPKWYSLLMTSGWKTPMVRNVARPMMSPM